MYAKAVKLAAVPAVLGLASFRVYAVKEGKHSGSITPQQLSIYSPPTSKLKYVDEQPGRLQGGFSVVRETVHPFVQRVKGAYTSVRNGAMNAVHFGQDTYIYLKDPPPGFLPRVSVIAVSGLAGLILARNGSRFKKVMFPLGLAAVGTSVCYPAQAVAAVKVSGKKVYVASHWASGTISSLWKPSPAEEAHAKLHNHEKELEAVSEPSIPVSPSSETPTDLSEKPRFSPDPRLLDHGQSNPEDSDMYSTRS
ncbi:MICOS complex subunit MIC27 isoform X2 [Polyodon spathula]|uniref:MICOS complex subunit MIC27 isoform X2 n=1 Tax=Polyodon spathula TaxID=7913 RepID=UPI001B7E2AC5|nr:MICOS complex subunit MIC27 isoform X2 [Polyodon spathula]